MYGSIYVDKIFCQNLSEVEKFIFKKFLGNRDHNNLIPDSSITMEVKCYDIKTHEKITPVCISDDNLLEKYEDIRPDHK